MVIGIISSAMFSIWDGYAYGLTTGLITGITAGIVSWFFYSVARPSVDSLSPLVPLVCWRRERRYRTVFGIVLGFAFGLVVAVASVQMLPEQQSVMDAITYDMQGAIPYGLIFGVVSSKTWIAGLAFCQLGLARLGPLG